MANIITIIRVFCGALILFFPPFSRWFYFFYIVGGVSDAVDGSLARRLGQESELGAKLDTAADLVFALSVTVRIILSIRIPLWLIIWTGIIIAAKIGNMIVGVIRYGELKTVHSVLNKVCGAVIYVLFLLTGCGFSYNAKSLICIFACILASAAVVSEGLTILNDAAKK